MRSSCGDVIGLVAAARAARSAVALELDGAVPVVGEGLDRYDLLIVPVMMQQGRR
ncbi:MAG: hypothetical protein RLW61_09860 [Gammaproteobacteria bacterium]